MNVRVQKECMSGRMPGMLRGAVAFTAETSQPSEAFLTLEVFTGRP